MTKQRLDILVTERKLAESREKAQRLILAGQVTVDGHVQAKPGHRFKCEAVVAVTQGLRYVGRGGDKLAAAFDSFDLDVSDLMCLDVGCSTGGFTDCMLQNGAARVYAIDVGKGLLHWKLRNDPRVVVMEKVNARYLEPDMFDLPIRFASIDVSFISLTKILPAVTQVLENGSQMVSLIKPQFEAERRQVGKGGVIRDPVVRAETVEKIHRFGSAELGLEWLGVHESPLKGPAGNIEYLAFFQKPGKFDGTDEVTASQ